MSNFYQTLGKWNVILIFGFLWFITFTDKIVAQRIDSDVQKKAELIAQKCNFTFEVMATDKVTTTKGEILAITNVLEEKYFTTEQLKKYFTCWSQEFPEIWLFSVGANSDKAVVQAWLDKLSRFSHPYPDTEEKYKTPPNHYEANYTRSADDGKESFFYNPDPKNWKRLTYKFKKTTVPLTKKKKRVKLSKIIEYEKTDINDSIFYNTSLK